MSNATILQPSSSAATSRPRLSVNARIWRNAWRSPEMKVATLLFLALCFLTLAGPFLIDASATKISVADKFLPPIFLEGGKYPYILGTDQLGRDLLLRSLVGLRNAFLIGVVSVILMFALGCAIGIFSGYRGGWTDVVLMRITDVQMSIPVGLMPISA